MLLSDEWPIVPERGRPLDKAIASAKTSSLGYLLRDLMVAPRVLPGDDMDDSARDAANQAAAEKAEVKKKTQPRKRKQQPKQKQQANQVDTWDEQAFEQQCRETGLEMSEVVQFLAHMKRPHPSQMLQADRAKILPWLAKPEGSKMLANFLINQANGPKEQEQ